MRLPTPAAVPPATPAAVPPATQARPGLLGLILPTLPQGGPPPDAGDLARLCRAAEVAGASTLWACDHVFWHGPVLECLTALTVASTATEGAALGSCVLQLPLRRTSVVAKQAAALHHLSGGRLLLGVGVGSHAGEYEAAGIAFADRGRLLDAGIDTLRALWSEPDELTRYGQRPAPGSGLPIWVGGSSEAARRRAARHGDGWIPLFVAVDEYGEALGRLDEEAERAGRDPTAITRAITVFVSVGGPDAAERGACWMGSMYGLPPKAFARHLVSGTARHCARQLERWFEAGAGHVAVYMTTDDPLVQFEDLSGELAGVVTSSPGRFQGD